MKFKREHAVLNIFDDDGHFRESKFDKVGEEGWRIVSTFKPSMSMGPMAILERECLVDENGRVFAYNKYKHLEQIQEILNSINEKLEKEET